MSHDRRPRSGGPAFAWLALGAVVTFGALPVAAQVQLQAGAAVAQITLPEGVPLAGYSARRAPLPDVLDLYPVRALLPALRGRDRGEEIRAKAVVLERSGVKLVFVSLDTVGVDAELRELITEELALPPLSFGANDVMISATHTHSGPGALTANHFLEYAATDRLHEDFRASFVTQVATLVEDAVTSRRLRQLVRLHGRGSRPSPTGARAPRAMATTG